MMIINPAAGKGGFKRSLPDALRLLSDAGYAVSLYFTECRGHATELATQYAGAISFFVSDSILFYVRFRKGRPFKTHFGVMLTYLLAEFLIVSGFILLAA